MTHLRRFLHHYPLWPALIILAVFFGYPVLELLSVSLTNLKGTFTFENYEKVLASAVYMKALKTTLVISGLVSVFSVVLAYPIAYLMATTSVSSRQILMLLVLLPFWSGFLVKTFAALIIFGFQGPVNQLLVSLGLVERPIEMINNMTAVVVSMTHSLMPLAVLTMFAVMENIDRRLVQAGATLGGSAAQTFWRIYFPLSLNGVLAAAVLVFISSLGFFITPAILGSPNETMIAQVIMRLVLEMSNWSVGGALAVILFLSALAIFLVFQLVFGSVAMGGEGTRGDKAGDGLLSRAGRSLLAGAANLTDAVAKLIPRGFPGNRMTLRFIGLAGIVFLAAPALIVIPVSFNDSQFLQFPPTSFSTRWYAEFFGSEIWMTATVRSLLVALATALIAVVVGTAAAFVLVREQVPGKGLLIGFIMAPLILPRMAVAVALFFFLARLGLASTPFALVIGHSILAIPYVVVAVSAVLKRYDRRLDQAASSLGASPARVYRHITLPLIRPGLFAAGLFAFITSFDDLNIALFVSGGLQNTLPNQMWSSMYLAASPILGAASTVILVTLSAVLITAELLRRAGERKLNLSGPES